MKNVHGFKPLTIFAKNFILNVWQGPKYVSLNNKGSTSIWKKRSRDWFNVYIDDFMYK